MHICNCKHIARSKHPPRSKQQVHALPVKTFTLLYPAGASGYRSSKQQQPSRALAA
jgi:hypothetical protein